MTDDFYDLVIIGAGVAATHTLLALLEAAPEQRLTIAVVEQSGEFWRGLPYGRRSSINSLTITDLDEFTPPFERTDFVAFLKDNWPALSAAMRAEGGATAAAWLQRHEAEIAAGDWGQLYIPRRLYGDFLAARVAARLAQSGVHVETLTARVRSVAPLPEGFDLVLDRDGGVIHLRGTRLLLATGSPPVQRLSDAAAEGALVIEDLYQPSLDDNLAALAHQMERLPEARRRLLVLGSNATSLELSYMLKGSPRLHRLVDRIVVLSGGGRWPERIMSSHESHPTPALDALDGHPALTADSIFEASQRDIAALVDASGPEGCDFSAISERLVHILAQAEEVQVRQFHYVHGMAFTRLIRRAGPEYRDAAQALIDDGKLDLRAGRLKALSLGVEGASPRVTDAARARADLGAAFAAVINCSGFEPLPKVSDPLVSGLLTQGLVCSNATGRGFEIDERFRAGERIFVAGPLLAGIFQPETRFWHVENVRRIAGLAPHLAQAILRDLEG